MSTPTKIPLVILAGSDRRAASLPDSGRGEHPLTGYKGVDVRIGGRPLVEIVASRLRNCGFFSPIYLVGPSRVYGATAHGVELIDADGTFARNIQVALDSLASTHAGPVAFTVCDILPEVETLRRVMQDYVLHAPCDLWFPLIQAPEHRKELGASSWKPHYRIAPGAGQPPVRILPGHLAVVDPGALRLHFLYRLVQLGYRTRNRSIRYRRGVMVRGVILELIYQDLRHLFALRAPTLTWSVLTTGLSAASRLRRGTITRPELEDALRKVFVNTRHRRRHPDRRVLLPVVEGISLALDIDTEEEARAVGGEISSRPA